MKIDKKIVGYSVKKPEDKEEKAARPTPVRAEDEGSNVIRMHEKLERPGTL